MSRPGWSLGDQPIGPRHVVRKCFFKHSMMVVISKIFYVHPIWGRWTHFDQYFSLVWNHQLEYDGGFPRPLVVFPYFKIFKSSRAICYDVKLIEWTFAKLIKDVRDIFKRPGGAEFLSIGASRSNFPLHKSAKLVRRLTGNLLWNLPCLMHPIFAPFMKYSHIFTTDTLYIYIHVP